MLMKIDCKIDTSALAAKTDREIKRLAYNTAQALNETAKAVQLQERANLDQKFQIRNARFMYKLIKIFKFANARQGRPWVEIGVDPTKKRVVLGIFERGGAKPAAKGKKVAVPLTGEAARPSFGQSVGTGFRFTSLHFQPHKTAGGKTQWKGAKRTFMLFPVPGGKLKVPGVFQRGGSLKTKSRGKRFRGMPSSTAIAMLYAFIQGPALKGTLHFINVAQTTISKEWREQFKKAYKR
jgi:hypothetical protein